MLEDSISCSPGNDIKRSRSRRFHKIPKRRTQQMTGASEANNCIAEEALCLDPLYEESIHSAVTQYEYFNPFENEIILAAADTVEASAADSKMKNFVSQGFVKLKELPAMDDYLFPAMNSPQCSTTVANPILGPETQFGITESEFVRFCDKAEIDVGSQPDSEAKTPKVSKSIVDAILEDFCGSPYSESPPKFETDDATPIFRFKSKSLRTYSGIRRKKSQRNIVTELINVHLPHDDGNASDSSGLSVQEDLSESAVPELDTVDLNKSIRVCENLLNLSSYFSQLTSHENSPLLSEEREKNSLSAIVKDIMEIRRKRFTLTCDNSGDEFHGFCDDDNDSNRNTLNELLEDEDDVLQQINCDSLCYEKFVPKVSFADNCSDIESTLEEVNAVIEEANKLILSRSDWDTKVDDSSSKIQINSDKYNNIPTNSLHNTSIEDEQLFDDVDLWKDNECLLNYKSQKPDSNPGLYLPLVGNTSQKTVCKKTDQLLSELEKTEGKRSIDEKYFNPGMNECNGLKKIPPEIQVQYRNLKTFGEVSSSTKHLSFKEPAHNPVCIGFSGFSTASKKPIAISNEAKRKADEILTKFEQSEIEQSMATDVDVPMASGYIFGKSNKIELKDSTRQLSIESDVSCERLSSIGKNLPEKSFCSTFQGFSTASKKPIAISNDAKRKAEEILRKFEQDERDKRMLEENEEATRKDLKQNNISLSDLAMKVATDHVDEAFQEFPSTKTKPEDSLSASSFVGFSTASKKPITISDEAKRKGDEILKKFEQAEAEERLQISKELTNTNNKLRNPVEVSEEVKRKAQDLLMDIEFFEEAFEEELKTMDQRPISEANNTQSLSVECSKQISSECQNVGGFKTASKKSIQISEVAKRHADQLLRKVDKEDLPQDFLQCIEADLNQVFANPTNLSGSSMDRVEKVDGASKNLESSQMAKLEKQYLHGNSNDNRMQNVNKEDHFDVIETELRDMNEEFYKNAESSSEKHDMTENRKRKRNIFNTEDLCESPVQISPRRLSTSERTPLNRIENGILHKTSSMPLLKPTPKSALISRKNLLSLSKRKKLSSPSRADATCAGSKATDIVQHSFNLHCNPNATPNLKEFFDSVSTSTPRLIRNGQSKVDTHLVKDSSIDTDFRQINWEDANNSASSRKASFITDSNGTCTEVSPSPKQRMDRLKMYGEPPPLSPILLVNKCRPSGLRRGRSLMKP